ncbi:MAG: hypothetical protein L6R41_005910 [Letrouitia leprolyta]|nr:MAG: hypothetical protein L6R41_005910 [Letrouitia leprolyta]
MFFPFPSLLLLVSFSLPFSHALLSCNGSPSLCSRSYTNITFLGAHDSPFIGSSPADNQVLSLPKQLSSGIRFLQAQTHLNPFKTLSLCHTNCFLNDAGSLSHYLSDIKQWLDDAKNQNEVLTLLLTNGDRLPPSAFAREFKSSRLDTYAYVPPANLTFTTWPTLSDLITSKKRLVVFLDYGAKPAQVPYVLDEFAHYFETPFDTTDPAFRQCKIDRPPKAKPEGRMYIVNHYLDKEIPAVGKLLGGDAVLVPDREAVGKTNKGEGKGSIGAQAELCAGMWGRRPNVLLLDFVDERVGEVQRKLNGL